MLVNPQAQYPELQIMCGIDSYNLFPIFTGDGVDDTAITLGK